MNRILIVEDYENLRLSLRACLEAEGFEVIDASTLKEAHTKLQLAPDLIVLDWMLPDGQGLDLLKHLRGVKDETPVIFLTARAETFDKVLGLELGANDYMTKPFEPRELVARARARLREAGKRAVEKNLEGEKYFNGRFAYDRPREAQSEFQKSRRGSREERVRPPPSLRRKPRESFFPGRNFK